MNRLIKSLTTGKFKVELYETPEGYQIQFDTNRGDVKQSETINDFNMAAFMFEAKIQELEGQ